MMQFSVVVPTHNRPEALAACLDSFCRLDYPAGAWELIVVNDGGERSFTAVSPRHRQKLPLTLLTRPQRGPATARNFGVDQARFEYLAFTDDDCHVVPDWLHQFATGFAQTNCDALGGSWGNPQPQNQAMQAAQFLIEFMYGYLRDEANNSLMLVSNNVAYRRAAFTAVSGFDETFPLAAGEDMELGYRLAAHGYRQQYWPAAQVWHHHNLSHWGHVQQQFRYGRGGHFFLQAIAKQQVVNGRIIQPGSAKEFYRALRHAVRQRQEPWSFTALVVAAQTAYRLGQFYQRQLSRLAAISTS